MQYLRLPQASTIITGNVDVDIHDSNGADIDLGQNTMANSLPVVIASNQTPIPTTNGALDYVTSARNDYSSANVTTGAWVQLIAATPSAAFGLYLFDSSGQTLELGVGAAAAESRVLIIPPGGLDGFIPLAIASGARVSVRAISATASAGEIDLTLLG